MERQQFHRRVYDKADTTGIYTISAMKFSPFTDQEKFKRQKVSSLSQYESGCRVHKHCFGHMCETLSGCVLPPQSMSMRTMEIATQYYAASKLAFSGKVEEYINALAETNYTKNGTYRVVMSTPVAGSIRLIAVPQWEYGRDRVAISRNLASRMRVCKKVYDEDGNTSGKYVESTLQEGDYLIVVRPPSLHYGNTQPMKVVFWNIDAMGIHPETFSVFHGDFDGDESHGYPVYDENSVAECRAWSIIPLSDFTSGRNLLTKLNDELEMKLSLDEVNDENMAHFLEYTTLSAKELQEKAQVLAFGRYSRNKPDHLLGMHTRFNSTTVASSFVEECIRGTEDVKEQQLSQGNLGDMTRVAKIAASCVYRPSSGSLYVKERDRSFLIIEDGKKDSGTPSVRGIMALCASAQQAKLNAHRVKIADDTMGSSNHDFISDLVLGCNRKTHLSSTSSYTYVQLKTPCIEKTQTCDRITLDDLCSLCSKLESTWKYVNSDASLINILCKPSSVKGGICKYVYAAYNPIILSTLVSSENNVLEICKRGITIVCNYYKIQVSPIELHDLAAVYSYRPGASRHPITSREGMMSRNLGWIETFQATDYTKLPSLQSEFEYPDSTSSATFMSNFDNLKVKY